MTSSQRGPVRQLAEVRGWVGGFRRPARDLELRTEDGVRIAATLLPGPTHHAPAVLVAHGFAAHRRKPAYAALADGLAEAATVLTIDHRGHGGSTGRSTFGDEERHDIAAGVGLLRAAGHATVTLVGASMGGTAVLHSLARGVDAAGAVTISTGAFSGRVRRRGIADLDAVVRHPMKRQLWQRLAGFRFVPPERLVGPPDPVALAVDVGVPSLIVHGCDDDYFPPSDADALAAAIPAASTVWHEPIGFGHAETGFTIDFVDRLRRAIVIHASEGRFPERVELTGH